MSNMSYCRFENTARDLRDCVYAIRSGETEDLNNYETQGLKDILKLCEEILEDKEFIQEILEDYD